ncbi:hypothetical protein [Fibrella aestuarina]|nr:hypothetical protein [Fibrella aestuarina]
MKWLLYLPAASICLMLGLICLLLLMMVRPLIVDWMGVRNHKNQLVNMANLNLVDKHLLTVATAKALKEKGLRLSTHFSWFVIDEHDLTHPALVRTSTLTERDFPCYPASSFSEIWELLPWKLEINGEMCGLHLQGMNMFGQYVAQYYYYPKMKSRLEGQITAATAVEAAGTLLLRLLEEGLVTADQINQVQDKLKQ